MKWKKNQNFLYFRSNMTRNLDDKRLKTTRQVKILIPKGNSLKKSQSSVNNKTLEVNTELRCRHGSYAQSLEGYFSSGPTLEENFTQLAQNLRSRCWWEQLEVCEEWADSVADWRDSPFSSQHCTGEKVLLGIRFFTFIRLVGLHLRF